MRVVSLICSATEIICALGHRDSLVGRSHECDFPRGIDALPALTEPQFNLDGGSADIDRRVKSLLHDGLAVYRVDADLMAALKPDVVVTQDQCDVCAASLSEVEAAVAEWTGQETQVVSCKPEGLDDIWADIRKVGAALDAAEKAEAVVAGLRQRMADVAAQAAGAGARPRVAMIEWIDPLMAAGNWMPTLVEMAGGENLFGDAGKHSPWMTCEELQQADPDVIVILPCGFDMKRSIAEMPALTGQPGWDNLKAVRSGRVAVTDGHQYFNRPGPRVAESLEILAEILHPEVFDFGWREVGWQPYGRRTDS